MARIKWDTPTLTVSEGIGYGMLIMVYMDTHKIILQAKFDKLLGLLPEILRMEMAL